MLRGDIWSDDNTATDETNPARRLFGNPPVHDISKCGWSAMLGWRPFLSPGSQRRVWSSGPTRQQFSRQPTIMRTVTGWRTIPSIDGTSWFVGTSTGRFRMHACTTRPSLAEPKPSPAAQIACQRTTGYILPAQS